MSPTRFGSSGMWGLPLLLLLIIPNLFTFRVEDPRLSHPFYLTPIYASCEATIRRDLWAGLQNISLDMDDPWLVGEDFNVITYDGEPTGHNIRNRGTIAF